MSEDSLIGTLFAGRFQVDALLGSGGMGAVYLVHHTVLGRKLALKVIHHDLKADLEVTARFRREARAASRMSNPHIVAVLDFGLSPEGRPYLVMEYVDGPTLAQYLAEHKEPLPIPCVLDILTQITEGLVAAHACHVVHRDLKPQNIILSREQGRPELVKILDFGLAKILGPETLGILSNMGTVYGTPKYMSPEQCTGQQIDHRSDLYSAGIMAYELVAGQVPFSGRLMQIMDMHVNKSPAGPATVSGRTDIPSELEQLILRCLAKKPEQRFPHARALLFALQDLREDMEQQTVVDAEILCEPDSPEHQDRLEPPLARRQTALGLTLPVVLSREPVAPAICEQAYDLRDRGLGSVEISIALTEQLRAEERYLGLLAEVSLQQDRLAILESYSLKRTTCLYQAQSLLEFELTCLAGLLPQGAKIQDEHSTADVLRSQQRVEENLTTIASELEQRQHELEKQLSTTRQDLETLTHHLEEAHGHLRRWERTLQELLQQVDVKEAPVHG